MTQQLADATASGGSRGARDFGGLVSRAVGTRAARNFFALVAAQMIVAAVGLASTRYLTPADKGLFTAVYLWSLVGQTLVGLSLPNALLYFGARDGVSWPSGRLLLCILGATLTVGGFLVLYVAVHASGHRALQAIVLVLPSTMFLFEAATYSILSRSGPFYVYRLLQALAFGGAGIPLLLATHSATYLTGALLLSYVVCFLPFLSRFTGRNPSRNARLTARRLLTWSLRGHAGLTLSLLATRLDLLFVTAFLTTTAAGFYAAASAFPNLLAFGGTALGLSLARRVTVERQFEGQGLIARWSALLVAANITAAIVLVGIRQPLVVGLFGRPYASAVDLVIPLTIALPFWSLAAYQSQVLSAMGKPIHLTIGQGLAAVILACGSAYGVSHNALEIVAWSNVIAYAASAIWQSAAVFGGRRGAV